MKVLKPPGWKAPVGYSDGVLAPGGRVLFLAGQVGWNPATTEFEARDMAGQAAQALENVAAALSAAGAKAENVCRMTWYVTDREAYLKSRPEIGAAYRKLFGRHYPAMTLVIVAGLLEEGALVEIEATAVLTNLIEKVAL
jgi:enamine deaminase RidA (YjgF/YER057c/UK114 family)